jgi:hypothetical protein
MRLALAFALLASPALGQAVTVVTPIYSQLVAFPTPADFKADYESEQQGTYILEFVPRAETVNTWSQMVTVTGAAGLAGQIPVEEFAERLASGYRNACPQTFAALKLDDPVIDGAVAVFAGYLGCGSTGAQSEAMVFVIVQGRSEVYSLQWAERGPALTAPPNPDPAIWLTRADALGQMRLCDPVAGEAAPYPSCTGN